MSTLLSFEKYVRLELENFASDVAPFGLTEQAVTNIALSWKMSALTGSNPGKNITRCNSPI